MEMNRIMGIAVFAVGVALLVFVYQSTSAPLEQISSTITGRYSNAAVWCFVVGIAAAVGGGLIAAFGVRR